MQFDRAFCINLDRSPDRLKRIQRQAERAGLSFERFSAVDGGTLDLTPHIRAGWLTGDIQIKLPGSLGTFLSHLTLWQRVYDDPEVEIALILEDDARFKPDFLSRLNDIPEAAIPNDWDMIWLGYFKAQGQAVNDWFLKPDSPAKRGRNSGHFCYLVKSASVPHLIDLMTPYANRQSKDVILRSRFPRFHAYFLKEKIAWSSRRSVVSDRKSRNPEILRDHFRRFWHRIRR